MMTARRPDHPRRRARRVRDLHRRTPGVHAPDAPGREGVKLFGISLKHFTLIGWSFSLGPTRTVKEKVLSRFNPFSWRN